ncbi:MAG: Bax inhibitor-1/YccA family protein [Sphingomonadales bacterium]|nr:Bax inhibitor-1/YccA family protein [Sphingomonadales bacterium]
MNERYQVRYSTTDAGTRADAAIDAGLRAYMLRVYNYMASGVLLTGILAMLTANSPAMINLLYAQNAAGGVGYSGLGWIVALAPLAFILVLSFGINRLSAVASQALFWAFAGVMGLSLSSIFLLYTGESIARVFFITAASFGALSLYGYTTKRDLSGWGTFLFMGLIGIIIASIVNWFLASPALYWTVSFLGVLIFAGLTAYDTQRIKNMYYEGDAADTATKKAVMGALSLYLDFINMFLLLLRFFGAARE